MIIMNRRNLSVGNVSEVGIRFLTVTLSMCRLILLCLIENMFLNGNVLLHSRLRLIRLNTVDNLLIGLLSDVFLPLYGNVPICMPFAVCA